MALFFSSSDQVMELGLQISFAKKFKDQICLVLNTGNTTRSPLQTLLNLVYRLRSSKWPSLL